MFSLSTPLRLILGITRHRIKHRLDCRSGCTAPFNFTFNDAINCYLSRQFFHFLLLNFPARILRMLLNSRKKLHYAMFPSFSVVAHAMLASIDENSIFLPSQLCVQFHWAKWKFIAFFIFIRVFIFLFLLLKP